jgi:hypothetical protein
VRSLRSLRQENREHVTEDSSLVTVGSERWKLASEAQDVRTLPTRVNQGERFMKQTENSAD